MGRRQGRHLEQQKGGRGRREMAWNNLYIAWLWRKVDLISCSQYSVRRVMKRCFALMDRSSYSNRAERSVDTKKLTLKYSEEFNSTFPNQLHALQVSESNHSPHPTSNHNNSPKPRCKMLSTAYPYSSSQSPSSTPVSHHWSLKATTAVSKSSSATITVPALAVLK